MIVYTSSLSYEQHVRRCLHDTEDVTIAQSEKGLPPACAGTPDVIVVHAASQPRGIHEALIKRLSETNKQLAQEQVL